MKGEARAVIIGSGICGSSIAYHLAEKGWRDLVVLEQGPLVSGTTSHAPGLVGQLRSNPSLVKLLIYSVSLYQSLKFNGEAGYFGVGSLRLASSKERLEELKRQAGFAKAVGLQAELLGPKEALKLFPLMSLAGVEGALYLPTDGSARALILAQALAQMARERGVEFHAETKVTGFDIQRGRVRAVHTTHGTIKTEIAVVASGIWSPRLGRLAGVNIPLTPMQHQYAMTAPLKELKGQGKNDSIANMRDPDKLVYTRQDGESLVLGGYEHTPAAFDSWSIPENANPTAQPFDRPRFAGLISGGEERLPCLRGVQWVKEMNGLESFTPDGDFILGEAPEAGGFWTACGFCAHGVSGSGGVGKAIAEWIADGEPSLDLWHMDIRRFGAHTSGRRYIVDRATETYKTYYSIIYPRQERSSARNLRLSPLYGRLQELGAVFGEKAGWERPNWFSTNQRAGEELGFPAPRGWARQYWSPAIGAEHEAARERVALFDETSFSKMEVGGPNALAFLQRLAANEMNKPVGSVTYTQMLNRRGGIECDLTVTRVAEDRFQIVTGTAFGTHDLAWIRKHLPANGSIYARDLTSSLCCVGAWGPRARELMSKASESDFSNAAFPYLTAQNIIIGEIPALALRVTYVGELGWEIYAPTEYGLKLWDALWEAGKLLGAVPAGYAAIDSLRLEKGYRYWSAEIHSEYNPYESGLGFCVKMEKGDFIGREALVKIKAQSLARKLCCLTITEPDAVALGGEPVLAGEKVLGRVTSGGFGYTVRQSIAYAYLPMDCAKPGTKLEIEMFSERFPVTVVKEPLYDPKGEKIKN